MHQTFTVTPFGGAEPLVQVGQMMMPGTFTAHMTDDDEGGPDLALTFAVRDGAPECREIRIRATGEGHEIRYSGIVGIRVEDVLEAALRDLMIDKQIRDAGEQLPRWLETGSGRSAVRESRTARAARKVKITDTLLREVAEVYRFNIKDQPTLAVADHFDRAHRTAALYVKRAREAGFLGAATIGKAGEK